MLFGVFRSISTKKKNKELRLVPLINCHPNQLLYCNKFLQTLSPQTSATITGFEGRITPILPHGHKQSHHSLRCPARRIQSQTNEISTINTQKAQKNEFRLHTTVIYRPSSVRIFERFLAICFLHFANSSRREFPSFSFFCVHLNSIHRALAYIGSIFPRCSLTYVTEPSGACIFSDICLTYREANLANFIIVK